MLSSRTTTALISMMLATLALLAIAGCDAFEPKVVSPYSDQEVTGSQLLAETQRAEREAEAAAKKAAADAEAKIRAARQKASREAMLIATNQDLAKADAARKLAQLEEDTGVEVDAAKLQLARAGEDLNATLERIESQTVEALRVIDQRRSSLLKLGETVQSIPVVGQALGATGLDISSLLALGLGGGVVYQSRRSRQLADRSWDEAKTEANAQREREDKLWDEAYAKARADVLADARSR
jgi:hypothetical protein